MSSRPRTEQVCISLREEAHAAVLVSTKPRERTAPEISISHTRRIPGPVQPCPSCSRLEMLVKEAYYIQNASLGWETGLTKYTFCLS